MVIHPLHDQFECFVYDGETATRHHGMLSLDPDAVRVDLENQTPNVWRYEDIELIWDGAYDEPVQMKSKNDPLTLIIHDPLFLQSLRQRRPNIADRPWWDIRLEGWPAVLMSCIVVSFLGSFIYYKGVPWFADTVAQFTPQNVEERMGVATANILVPAGNRCSSTEREQLLRRVSDRLIAADNSGYQYKIIYARLGMFNAFAAPGGVIVVSDSLIKAVDTPEELAGVLAHEMQHVIQKHSTRAIARKMGGRAILSIMSFDSAGTPLGMEQAAGLADLSFQRSDEENADVAAMDLLVKARIRPNGLIQFLERVERYTGGSHMKYLSTHPATQDRISKLRSILPARYEFEDIMTPEEWKKAQDVCVIYAKDASSEMPSQKW